jgi:flagellin-like hook-associated protein FlgL
MQIIETFYTKYLNHASLERNLIGNAKTSEPAIKTLGIEIENLTAPESTLADTGLAAEIATLQQGLLGFQTSIQSLANQLQFENQAQSRLLDTLG